MPAVPAKTFFARWQDSQEGTAQSTASNQRGSERKEPRGTKETARQSSIMSSDEVVGPKAGYERDPLTKVDLQLWKGIGNRESGAVKHKPSSRRFKMAPT